MKYLLLLILAIPNAYADYRHEYRAPTTSITDGDTALAIATAQHNFSWTTKKWQGSVGYGYYNSSEGFSFGLGKNIDGILINFSVGKGEEFGGGAGASWRW